MAYKNPEDARKWRAANKDKKNAWNRKDYRANPEKYRNNTRKWELKKFYKLTPEQYREMNEVQENKCYLCKQESKKALCVDHNHQTGQVRKLLCHRCNLSVAYIESLSRTTLQEVLRYLGIR